MAVSIFLDTREFPSDIPNGAFPTWTDYISAQLPGTCYFLLLLIALVMSFRATEARFAWRYIAMFWAFGLLLFCIRPDAFLPYATNASHRFALLELAWQLVSSVALATIILTPIRLSLGFQTKKKRISFLAFCVFSVLTIMQFLIYKAENPGSEFWRSYHFNHARMTSFHLIELCGLIAIVALLGWTGLPCTPRIISRSGKRVVSWINMGEP